MDPLDRLPEVTEQALSGLQADDAMKRRILLSAANSPQKKNTGSGQLSRFAAFPFS